MSRLLRQRLVALSLGLCGLITAAQAAGPMVAAAALDAPGLIKRVQDASQRRSFNGTFVISAAGQMSSSHIIHFGDGQNQVERIDSLDGQMRQVFRHNDEVRVLWPRAHLMSIEQREAVRDFPATISTEASHPLDLYEIQTSSHSERIAGYEAQVVLLKPRDALRFAQRWWLERDSGLLLRTDMLGEHGEVMESAAFSTLQIGVRVSPQPLLQEMNRLDGYKVSRPVLLPTHLDREGWSLRVPVSGFRPISCVRRPGSQFAREPAPASAPLNPAGNSPEPDTMLQAIYSDGLTHVSIFIEPYRADASQTETQLVMGATHAVTRRQGDWWITAVGDVPPLTLRQFVQALERRKP
jgi:sigma-E factor negative regulatory protein RseB